jgi:hypothetical protein
MRRKLALTGLVLLGSVLGALAGDRGAKRAGDEGPD